MGSAVGGEPPSLRIKLRRAQQKGTENTEADRKVLETAHAIDKCFLYGHPSRMITVEKVRDEVMTLSASERANLAHELILSLDDPADYDLSPTQEAEIQRRVKMVRDGDAAGRPSGEVFADIRARYS